MEEQDCVQHRNLTVCLWQKHLPGTTMGKKSLWHPVGEQKLGREKSWWEWRCSQRRKLLIMPSQCTQLESPSYGLSHTGLQKHSYQQIKTIKPITYGLFWKSLVQDGSQHVSSCILLVPMSFCCSCEAGDKLWELLSAGWAAAP